MTRPYGLIAKSKKKTTGSGVFSQLILGEIILIVWTLVNVISTYEYSFDSFFMVLTLKLELYAYNDL